MLELDSESPSKKIKKKENKKNKRIDSQSPLKFDNP